MTLESEGSQNNPAATRASNQSECDAIVAAARENSARPSILREFTPPPPLLPTDDIVETRLAEEIEYARRLLDAVSDRLIADPFILARHETTLQSFDIVGQLLG